MSTTNVRQGVSCLILGFILSDKICHIWRELKETASIKVDRLTQLIFIAQQTPFSTSIALNSNQQPLKIGRTPVFGQDRGGPGERLEALNRPGSVEARVETIASILAKDTYKWNPSLEIKLVRFETIVKTVTDLYNERKAQKNPHLVLQWFHKKIFRHIQKPCIRLYRIIKNRFYQQLSKKLPENMFQPFHTWLRTQGFEKDFCPISGDFITQPISHRTRKDLVVNKAHITDAQAQGRSFLMIKGERIPLSSFKRDTNETEEKLAKKKEKILQEAFLLQVNTNAFLGQYFKWQETSQENISLCKSVSNERFSSLEERSVLFLEWVQKHTEGPLHICPVSKKFLLHPIAHKEERNLFVNQEVLLQARSEGKETLLINEKEYPLSSFEETVEPKIEQLMLKNYTTFWAMYFTDIASRTQLIRDLSLMTKPNELQEIPLSFCEEGSIAEPKCAITGRAIRHFRAPIAPNSTKEEKKVIYEKAALEKWSVDHPNTHPPHWPKNVPFDNDHVQTPELWQINRDSTLEDLAIQAKIDFMTWNTTRPF